MSLSSLQQKWMAGFAKASRLVREGKAGGVAKGALRAGEADALYLRGPLRKVRTGEMLAKQYVVRDAAGGHAGHASLEKGGGEHWKNPGKATLITSDLKREFKGFSSDHINRPGGLGEQARLMNPDVQEMNGKFVVGKPVAAPREHFLRYLKRRMERHGR